jgi:hypothetical protein
LITATDIFAISSQSNLKNSLKSISISTRKQLGVQRVLRPNESGVAKKKTLNRFRFTHSVFQRAMLWFLIPGRKYITQPDLTSKHFNRYFYLYGKLPKGFSQFYGNIEDYVVLALLPSYLEGKDRL